MQLAVCCTHPNQFQLPRPATGAPNLWMNCNMTSVGSASMLLLLIGIRMTFGMLRKLQNSGVSQREPMTNSTTHKLLSGSSLTHKLFLKVIASPIARSASNRNVANVTSNTNSVGLRSVIIKRTVSWRIVTAVVGLIHFSEALHPMWSHVAFAITHL